MSCERVDVEKELRTLLAKFDALGNITRATWYEFRQAALEFARPGTTPMDIVLRAWEIVGHDTAKAYVTSLDLSKPTFLEDIGRLIVQSSTMMGESARLRRGGGPNEVFVEWDRCPWPEFARRYGATMEEDVLGCDRWFQTVIKDINDIFGTDVKLETLSAIPRGDRTCTRRLTMSARPGRSGSGGGGGGGAGGKNSGAEGASEADERSRGVRGDEVGGGAKRGGK
ncbi:MAG: hypothetical protein QW379_10200 [Thermoplasmata archaeon]